MARLVYLELRQFNSTEEIKAHDIELVKKQMGRDMKGEYTYVYDATPIMQRYVAENHIGFIGMVNITYSFIDNIKEVRFQSGTNPRFDVEISSNSLETNLSCMLRIPLYRERDEPRELGSHELRKLPVWY